MDKAEQILQAARTLFDRLGYAKTTVEDIAQALGMKKSSLYYYYPSKQALYVRAYSAAWAKELAQLWRTSAREPDPEARILAIAEASVRANEHRIKGGVPIAIVLETRNLIPEIWENTELQKQSLFAQALEEGIAAGHFAPMDVPRVVQTIIKVGYSLYYDRLQRAVAAKEIHLDFEALRQEHHFALQLLLKGLRN